MDMLRKWQILGYSIGQHGGPPCFANLPGKFAKKNLANKIQWAFSNLVSQTVTVELRFVCNNHVFQPNLLFHLTIFLSTGEFFSRLSSLCFLNLHLACVCVGVLHASALGGEGSSCRLRRWSKAGQPATVTAVTVPGLGTAETASLREESNISPECSVRSRTVTDGPFRVLLASSAYAQ